MNPATVLICNHCGLPLSRQHKASEGPAYCCYGCEVASFLFGSGDEAEARMAQYKLAAGVVLGINVMMFSMPLYVESLGSFFSQGLGSHSYFELLKWLLLVLSLPVFFLLGMPFVESSVRNIKQGLRSNADLLIAIGVSAAMIVSIFNTIVSSGPVYYETAAAILVIVTAGRYLEAKARAKASRTVEQLDTQLPHYATSITSDGSMREVRIDSLRPGHLILCKPGEMVAVDSIIRNGSSRINEAMLSGESEPVERHIGESLLAGAINYDGLLQLEVVHPFETSFIQRLKTLLLESKLHRAKIQDVADSVAAIAVPIIIVIALGSLGYWWWSQSLRAGLYAFLSVVLVACPCAIGIATPAALWVSVTEASKRGILIRSLGVIEQIASIKKIIFDKTGTITNGTPVVDSIFIKSGKQLESQELNLIASVAALSSHPLSQTVANEFGFSGSDTHVSQLTEAAGKGISAIVNGHRVRIGSEKFVIGENSHSIAATTVWCSVDEAVIEIELKDTLRKEAQEVFKNLHSEHYETLILSGDKQCVVNSQAEILHSPGIGDLLPQEKANIVADEPGAMFIGDGFNDAGAIGAATIGIAMGGSTDLIRSEADVILFENDLRRIPELLQLAKRTMQIVKQNFFWAFIYNVIGVVLAAMGLLNPIIASVAMALSSFAVAQNSLRIRTRSAS